LNCRDRATRLEKAEESLGSPIDGLVMMNNTMIGIIEMRMSVEIRAIKTLATWILSIAKPQ
jgi:hypothetical protein